VGGAPRDSQPPERRDAKQQLLAAKLAPLECELIPIWFDVSLVHDLPQVMVALHAVNYLSKELVLDRVAVEYFHLNQGPPLEDIFATGVTVQPRQSRQVYCRRKLLESEIRAFGNCPEQKQYEATIRVSMKGHAGKRPVTYQPGSNLMIPWSLSTVRIRALDP
jgi:hypothetical protein